MQRLETEEDKKDFFDILPDGLISSEIIPNLDDQSFATFTRTRKRINHISQQQPTLYRSQDDNNQYKEIGTHADVRKFLNNVDERKKKEELYKEHEKIRQALRDNLTSFSKTDVAIGTAICIGTTYALSESLNVVAAPVGCCITFGSLRLFSIVRTELSNSQINKIDDEINKIDDHLKNKPQVFLMKK